MFTDMLVSVSVIMTIVTSMFAVGFVPRRRRYRQQERLADATVWAAIQRQSREAVKVGCATPHPREIRAK